MSPLTLFDARNAATVRRAMQDAAQRGMPITFGERIALGVTPKRTSWRVLTRSTRWQPWTIAADRVPFDVAADLVTYYARNLRD